MKTAKLRVCASCEWIFNKGVGCPKCHFSSYGAHYVYGRAAYRYAKTQKPWLENKLAKKQIELALYKNQLMQEIWESRNEL